MASLQAAATSLRDPRLPDDPVLHLLLDVRLPADRRPDLGAGRRPRPRLHDGRDRRPDDADTARASSTTTATRHLLASTVPNFRAYDPAYAYELAAIVRDGIERMYAKGEDVFYYVTLYNENYAQPPKPDGVDEGIIRGLYRFREAPDLGRKAHRARLVGSGSILQQVDRRPGAARREVRDRRRDLLRAVVPAAPPRRARGRALEPAPSRQGAARPVRLDGPRPGRRADRRRDRLDEGAARHGRALAAAVLRLARAPTASAGATRARRCGRCSRSTPPTSRRRRSPSWPAARRSRPRRRRPASASWASTRRSSTRSRSSLRLARPRRRGRAAR